MPRWLSCQDVKEVLNNLDIGCCSSCHYDDEELGVPLSYIALSQTSEVEVCCTVGIAWDDSPPDVQFEATIDLLIRMFRDA